MNSIRDILTTVIVVLIIAVTTVFAQEEYRNGVSLYKQGKYDKAIEELKRASKMDRESAKVWNQLGLAYLKRGNTNKARKAFRNAVKYKPLNSAYVTNLAYSYFRIGKMDNAQNLFNEALRLNPKNTNAYYYRGNLFLRKNQFKKAISDAEKAILINPNYVPSYFLKANALLYAFGIDWINIKDKSLATSFIERNIYMVNESIEALESCRLDCKKAAAGFDIGEWIESIKTFYLYLDEKARNLDGKSDGSNVSDSSGFRITSKPRPSYTDLARSKNIQGTVYLLILFSAERKIKNIYVLKGLGGGLSETAIKAARKIKFTLPMIEGVPTSTLRIIQYNYTIY